jgi:sugar/nucleoside kinase (ribokinase family)
VSRVAIVGTLAVDRVAGGPPRAGGGVYYGARAAALLAADASVAARCAPVDTAVCLEPLEALGLPVTWRPGSVTAAFSFHYEGDRRVMEVLAVGDPWLPADVTGWAAAALDGAAWIHVAGLLRSDFPAETLLELARRGRVLVDAQGLVRRPQPGPLVRDDDVDPETFRHVTVLKLNEGEAHALAGGTSAEALRWLAVPEIVLTLGSRGSLVVTRSHAEHIEIAPVTGAVDPTGAGDSFSLAYLVARGAGAEPVEAARTASDFVSALLTA